MEIDMMALILRFGIPGLIRMMSEACREKHVYYAPTPSMFSIWADVLEQHLPRMKEEVELEVVRLTNERKRLSAIGSTDTDRQAGS